MQGTTAVAGEGNVYLLGAYVPATGVMLLQTELAAGEGELRGALSPTSSEPWTCLSPANRGFAGAMKNELPALTAWGLGGNM